MTETAKIKAIAPWFGGKRTMARAIVDELGPHAQYFEPFCGSLAVLFAKPQCRLETVNDLHEDLINLARVIQRPGDAEQLYDRLQRVLFSEDLLHQARDMLAEPGPQTFDKAIERAYWYFLASWMGRNGTAGTERVDYQIAVRWRASGGSPTVRWRNVVESLPWWHRRLQNVVILCRDVFRIIDRFEDSEKTAIYVDSPYHRDARAYTKNGAGSRYLHEFAHEASMFDPDDHTRLRDVLAGYRRARVVVSHYDCEAVRKLYDGWTFVDKTRHKHLTVQNRRGAKRTVAPEVLIINGASYEQ